jgi:hypothetical protein
MVPIYQAPAVDELVEELGLRPTDLLALLEKRHRRAVAGCIGSHCEAHCHGHPSSRPLVGRIGLTGGTTQ